jgi:hypothetical protein
LRFSEKEEAEKLLGDLAVVIRARSWAIEFKSGMAFLSLRQKNNY